MTLRQILGWSILIVPLVVTPPLATLVVVKRMQAQSKMGPLIGTRLPLYDQLTKRYWTPETQLDWDSSFGLRQNADGTQTVFVKFPPPQPSYVGGPTGAIIVSNDKNPPEIDIATTVVPQKGLSETIDGLWTFKQPIVIQHDLAAWFSWKDPDAAPGRFYNIYRATGSCDGVTFTQIGSAPVTGTFLDWTIPQPGDYCYLVKAHVGGVEQASSNPLLLTVTAAQFVTVGR